MGAVSELVSAHSLINGRSLRALTTCRLVALLLISACCSCTGKDGEKHQEFPFTAIRLAMIEPREGLPLIPCPLEAAAMLALAATQGPLPDRPGLALSVACYELPEGGYGVVARAELELTRPGEPEVEFEAEADYRCPKCSSLLLPTARSLRQALKKAVAQLIVTRSDADVVAALSSVDVEREVLLAAIEAAGDRRLTGTVSSLITLLGSSDEVVVMRAIGALGRIGDPAAIRPLGRLALSRVPEIPHVALRAIADIGGPEARRTLEMVGNQTTDAFIVREVRELLHELGEGE